MRTTIFERALALLGSLSVAMLLSMLPATTWSATATINPGQDNTVAQELADNSSGACDSIFSGMIDVATLDGARRALMQFDIAGNIPPNSTITSVTLNMAVTRGGNHVDSTFTLHPNTAAWIEGVDGCGVRGGGQGVPSTGGVTWDTMPGSGAASGSTLINTTTPVWNSTQAMVDDVQDWLDNPGTNYGWVLIGDETTKTTTRRFDSREGAAAPSLFVDSTLTRTPRSRRVVKPTATARSQQQDQEPVVVIPRVKVAPATPTCACSRVVPAAMLTTPVLTPTG